MAAQTVASHAVAKLTRRKASAPMQMPSGSTPVDQAARETDRSASSSILRPSSTRIWKVTRSRSNSRSRFRPGVSGPERPLEGVFKFSIGDAQRHGHGTSSQLCRLDKAPVVDFKNVAGWDVAHHYGEQDRRGW